MCPTGSCQDCFLAADAKVRLLTYIYIIHVHILCTRCVCIRLQTFYYLHSLNLKTKSHTHTHLIAIVDKIVNSDERLEDHHPVAVLRTLDQQVGQLWDGHVWLVCALQQIWNKKQHPPSNWIMCIAADLEQKKSIHHQTKSCALQQIWTKNSIHHQTESCL